MNQDLEVFQTVDYKTNKTNAFIKSAIVYACLLASLYFLKIAYEPVVEIEALGVDLNYGVDLIGSGDIQTMNKANDSKIKEEMKPDKGAEKPVEAKPKPIPQPIKAAEPKAVKTKILTADEDTKVTASEEKTKSKPAPVVKPVEKIVPKVEAKPAPAAKPSPPAPPARTVDGASTMKKNPNGAAGSNGSVGTKAGVGGNNNGDGKPGEVGDKGDPRGTLDGKSLYGNPGKPGGSSGSTVSISGWKNKGPLNIPKDNSNETGRIKFKVVIDDYGDVQRIDVLETSVSPSITNYYKNQIMSKLKANLIPEGTPPPKSTGTITINITRGA